MSNDFFALYDALLAGVDSATPVLSIAMGEQWCLAAAGTGLGLAMHTPGASIPPLYPAGLAGLPLSQAAQAVKSWNLEEASFALAAANAFYNTPERLAGLPNYGHYADGLDFTGKTVGIVGHLHGPAGLREQAREIYVLERDPRPGDYPDSACDDLLPRCDTVIITAGALVNKTLPHLLSLCRSAYTILAGPSCPMYPNMLELGIHRLAGLVITDRAGMRGKILGESPGPPYPMGIPFLLTVDRS